MTNLPIPTDTSTSNAPLTAIDAWSMPVFAPISFPQREVAEVEAVELPLDGHIVDAPLPVAVETFATDEEVEVEEEEETVKMLADELPAPPRSMARAESISPPVNPYVRGETSEIWGLKLDRVGIDEATEAIGRMIAERTPRYVITANLHFAMLASQDERVQNISDDSAMVVADGAPLVWRSRIGAAGRLPERVAGSELIYRIAERAAQRGWRIYFLGGEPGVGQQCADALTKQYPGLQVAGVQSPPFRPLSESEQQSLNQSIVDAQADILLVAFGQPKGESWIHANYKSLGVPVSIQLGASFDFVAGKVKRAPKVWQRLGLEWAYRMFHDPGRLVPRYASNAGFLCLSLIRDWRDYVDARFGCE